MRKYTWVLALSAAVVVMAAQGGGLLSAFVKQLSEAKSLKASYSAGTVSGSMAGYDVAFAKPNMARIETPSQIIVADGKSVTTYDKTSKTYFRDAQNASSLAGLMQDEALNIWMPFFDPKALDKVAAKSIGQKTYKGTSYNVVQATYTGGKKVVNYYLDPSGMARVAQISYSDTNEAALVLTKTIELGTADSALFAFNPPSGSRQLTDEERFSSKWFTDLNEALAAAKKMNKLVMIDFDATWCGPCQRLKAEVYSTEKFKSYSKYFVFCEIDVDEQPALASQYKASSIPAVHFLKSDGTEIHSFVGYSNPEQVFGEMNKAMQLGGK